MLKRCVSKLIREVQVRDDVRAQARVKYMNQVLLPRCYSSFTQLVRDTQFSTVGLTLIAELSRIRRLVALYTDPAENELGPATNLVNSRDSFPLISSEDVGEALGRTTSSNPTGGVIYPVLTFATLAGRELGRVTGKPLHERAEAGLDAIRPANGETELPQPKTGVAAAGLESYASSAPTKEQRKGKPVNAIDDLFQGLN